MELASTPKKQGNGSGTTPEDKGGLKDGQGAPTQRVIKVGYTNTCSVRNKWMELAALGDKLKTEVIAISETWLSLDDHIPGSILDQFKIYRQDRLT